MSILQSFIGNKSDTQSSTAGATDDATADYQLVNHSDNTTVSNATSNTDITRYTYEPLDSSDVVVQIDGNDMYSIKYINPY